MSQARWKSTIGAAASTLGLLGLLSGLGCRSASSLVLNGAAADPNASPTPSSFSNSNSDALGNVQQGTLGQSQFRAKTTPEQEYQVHMDLGRSYEAQGSFDAAVSEYQQALAVCDRPAKSMTLPFGNGPKINGDQKAGAHRRIAAALDRLGQFAQAESHYREALALLPNNPSIWNDAGYSYYLQGRWIEAEQSLRTAARIAPADTKIWTNLGLALAAGGKTAEAFDAMARVAGPAAAHANLGYVLASTGNSQEARRHYQSALQMQPDYAPFQTALARIGDQPSQAPPPPQIPIQQAQQMLQPPSPSIPMQYPAAVQAPYASGAAPMFGPGPGPMMAQSGAVMPVAPTGPMIPPTAIQPPPNLAANQPGMAAMAPMVAPASPSPGMAATQFPAPPPVNLPAFAAMGGYAQDPSVARASAATGIPMPHPPGLR